MTVIKAFSSEKKPIDIEPLVDNGIPPADDVEARGGDEEPTHVDPHLLMMRVRAKRASTITTLVLIVTCALVLTIAMCGGFYIYKQFARARQLQRFRAFCDVPYYDDGQDHIIFHDRLIQDNNNDNSIVANDNNNIDNKNMEMFSDLLDKAETMAAQAFKNFQRAEDAQSMLMGSEAVEPPSKSFREEFELDLKSDSYEKIHVPGFERGRHSKFIHDFHYNKTAIVDMEGERCFVMPLNRTTVLPPKSLFDLIKKMWSGYYTMTPPHLSEAYRAINEPIVDMADLGVYIAKECEDYPIYRLEKAEGGIVKRSADLETPNKAFTVLDGSQPRAIEIVNIENLPPQAVQKK